MERLLRSPAFPYAVALLATLFSLALRALMGIWLDDQVTFSTVYAAIALAVWVGGYRPALLTCMLGYLGCYFLFITSNAQSPVSAQSLFAASGLYLLTSGVIIWLGELGRLGQRRKEMIEDSRRLTSELRQRIEEMETLMDLLPVAVVIAHDPSCRTMTGNRAARTLYAVAEEANLSKTADASQATRHFRILHQGRELAPQELPIQRAAQTGQEQRGVELEIVFDDACRRFVNGDVSPLFDRHGQVRGAVAVYADVTERRLSETALRESELRLRTLSDNLPDGAIYQAQGDDQGAVRFTFLSAGIQSILGVSAQEVMHDATKLYRLIHPEDASRVLAIEAEAIRTETPFVCEFRSLNTQGKTVWIHVRSAPRKGANGRVWDGVILNITSRKHVEDALKESEEKYRRIVETANEGIWVLDENARIVFANRRLSDMLGYPLAELIGRQKWDYVLPEQQQAVREMFERRRQGQRDQTDVGFRHRSGQAIWALMAAEPIFEDGVFRGSLDMFTDVTQRRAAELSLRDADRRKNEFLATLSHELRNPLAPIRNALELMRRAEGNAEVQSRARDMMERQLSQLVRLVDDLLDVSRITRNKLQLRRERVELHAAVQSAVEATRPMMDAAGQVLSVDIPAAPIHLDADPTRLAQVFANLLNNASKYTDREGRIALTARREGTQLTVSVKDSGIGINAEHLPRLFDMFSQVVPALERSQGGLGIGLSLVKGLVEMHGGSVEAHSEGVGRGSEFIVRLPVLPESLAPNGQPAPGVRTTGTGKSSRILVVDDNRDGADSLATVLRIMGHDLRTAYDGQQALDAAEAFRPSIVLLDIGLPRLNGYEVAQRIRAQDWGKAMTLIALTGWGQEDDKRRALEAGFNRHVTKPVDPGMLDRLLNGST